MKNLTGRITQINIDGSWVLLLVVFLMTSCKTLMIQETKPTFIVHESGLSYMVVKSGNGIKPALNDIVKVHYTLMLEDSTLIDSSYKRGEPVSFKVGAGQVISGWDISITLLGEGDEAILKIPPELGYGDRSVGDIPANSTLIFNVNIIDVIPAPKPMTIPDGASKVESPSGLSYAIVEKGRGVQLLSGMKVKVHYTGFFEDFSIFDSSYERDQPIELTLGRGMVIRGWEEGLSYLRVGDKARLWVPYQLAYGEFGRGPIPPKANLIFDVYIVDAIESARIQPFNTLNKDTLVTPSGLKYMVIEAGRNSVPETGSIVTVHYSGFLPDGKMFDSSVERGQPFRFVLGQGQVITGWDEGVALMRVGAKYRFIIPSNLAYGQRGIGPIPADATLIFDVELIDFE